MAQGVLDPLSLVSGVVFNTTNSRARGAPGATPSRRAIANLPSTSGRSASPLVLMTNTRGNQRDASQTLRIHSQSRCPILLVPSPPPPFKLLRFEVFFAKNVERCANRGLKTRFSQTRFYCKFSILAPPNPSKTANGDRIIDILQF